MSIEEKLSACTKLAQLYIRLLLKEYMNTEQLQDVEDLFLRFSVVPETNYKEISEFGKVTINGGYAFPDKITISERDIEVTSISNENELNKLVGTIIHEYAHRIRAINNKYGEMFEEAFASIFAEMCINNAMLKLSENKEVFGMLDSVKYQKYESQVRGILYILKQKGLDKELIVEYIAGNQEIFKQTCIQVFGDRFNDYFDNVTSRDNNGSEEMIINIIAQYIKQNGLNISNYWDKDIDQLSPNNLYFSGSPTLCRGIVNAGKESFKPEEQEFYSRCEYSVKVADDEVKFVEQEKNDRIRNVIETRYSLTGKSSEEIHDIVIDLCSDYIQHQNRTDEESKKFMDEMLKWMPTIEEFISKFKKLRAIGLDKNIFDNLDLKSITYNDIMLKIDNTINTIENEKKQI